jgi:hypothetical protein
MRSVVVAKLAIGGLVVSLGGGLAGVGLANYVESGSFEFYRQARVADWTPEPARARFQSTDLTYASDYRDGAQAAAPQATFASFEP